jgi:predicted DNA-binding transcriptional regulator AlpA
MPPKAPVTVQELAEALQRLERRLTNTPRLFLKDVLRRYGFSRRTLYRKLKRGEIPRPIRFSGPLWRLEDLEEAELRGQLPPPMSA